MPPRVTYWTGTWDAAQEAISKEIDALRIGGRARAPVVAIAPRQRIRLRSREGVLTLSDGAWPLLRAVAAFIERRGDVSHVFGGGASWHLLRALGRRPVLLTAVVAGAPSGPLPRVPDFVAVEADLAAAAWLAAGVPEARIRTIFPGIDLEHFTPLACPDGRFTLLFASSPSDPAEFDGRGLPLLVGLARARPDVDVLVPWRQWGPVPEARRALEDLEPPDNFVVRHEPVRDMRELMAQAHATIALFSPGVGKLCPTFVIEGLACGRPSLLASTSAVAPLLGGGGAAVVADRDVPSLVTALDRLTREHSRLAQRARAVAESTFDVRRFRADYDALYATLSAPSTSR